MLPPASRSERRRLRQPSLRRHRLRRLLLATGRLLLATGKSKRDMEAASCMGAAFFPMRWLACLFCIAWSAALSAAEPVRSLLEIRQENVMVQQWDTSCGAAALGTLLKYQHGLTLSEKQIAEGMLRRTDPLKVKTRGGFSLLDLKRYADRQGLEGVGYLNAGLDDLLGMAPAVVPVVVRGYPHFVVVRGKL